jgi:small conductance mechanosensitive channel
MFHLNFPYERFLSFAYNFSLALMVAVFFYFATRWILHGVKKANEKVQKINPTLMPITVTVIKYSAFIVTVFIILNIFGVNTNGIVALLGAAGLGLALALKDTLQNIASGIMLIFLRPFQVSDYIECGAQSGTVEEINLFTTTLKTPDGIFLFLPNNLLWNTAIRNYNRNGARRLDFVVGVSYQADLGKACGILSHIANQDKRILKDPPILIVVNALGESSVSLLLRCWIRVENYWDVHFFLYKTVKESFDAAGISIPFPQREIHLLTAPK